VEPLNDDMTFITFGEGRRIPAVGAAGAASTMIDTKVGRLELVEGDRHETIRENVIKVIKPGDRITNMNPGGGGYGNPMERSIDKVLWDVKNGLVSIEGAKAGLRRHHHRCGHPGRGHPRNRSPARDPSRRGCEVRGVWT
jgi:N-methylhydantoinase B